MSELLVVDDEPQIARALRRELKQTCWRLTAADSAEHALTLIRERAFDVVIADYRMAGMDGVKLLTRVRQVDPTIVRIVLSGYTDAETLLRSVNDAGIFKFLVKPWDPDAVQNALFQAEIERHRLVRTQQVLAELRDLELAAARSESG